MQTAMDILTIADLHRQCNEARQALNIERAGVTALNLECEGLQAEIDALDEQTHRMREAYAQASAEWNADLVISDQVGRVHDTRVQWLMQLPPRFSPMSRAQKTILLLLAERSAARIMDHGVRYLTAAAPQLREQFAQRTRPLAVVDQALAQIEAGPAAQKAVPSDLGLSSENYNWLTGGLAPGAD